MNKKQKGFTLIELIVVIVILGILAVAAAPKFIDMSRDARLSTLKGMEAALKSGADLVYSKALLEGRTEGGDTITDAGDIIQIHSGYPVGFWNSSIRYVIGLDDVAFLSDYDTVCAADWCGNGDNIFIPSGMSVVRPARFVKIIPRGYTYRDECGVYYLNREDGSGPEIGIESAEC